MLRILISDHYNAITLNIFQRDDAYFMRMALQQAQYAMEEGEVPVGAVVVADGRIIAKAYNQTEKLQDPTAHAEMLAMTSAFHYLGAKYLPGCTLYVTLEPCLMCAGAQYWAQVGTLVYGADDVERGFTTYGISPLHPKTKIKKGILADESRKLIQTFFRQLRK